MILTCEECHTRYLLPTHLLGADGRRVRCTICSHEWFQTPEEESFADILAEVPPLQDSVNQYHDDDLPVLAQDVIPAESEKFNFEPGMLAGMAAAALVGIVIFAGLVIFRAPVMKAWPDSLALYDAMELAGPIPGEGLVFENLKATTSYNAKGVEILSVTGEVMNIRAYPVRVPGLRFALRREDGSEVESWSYASPAADILAQKSIPLTATYPQIAVDVKALNVRFVEE